MLKTKPISGQRWVSDTEPELGLGLLLKAEYGRAEIFFPAANEHRQYALASAPLRRVEFQTGDTIKTHTGKEYLVEETREENGILAYRSGDQWIPEAELADTISFSKPEDRLLIGQVDPLEVFALRSQALAVRGKIRNCPARGFLGGRIQLLPHQLSVAQEVTSRQLPRVLLADEVGLGKTIEAGLILHRLHLTGRASRVLILLPEPLIHQWFIELWRRFNLLFSIFDEERCLSLDTETNPQNPFLDSQLVICGINYLSAHAKRSAQVAEAGWDVVVVDEAHHLFWSEAEVSPEYRLVERLAAVVPGILLLTATPQQLGPEGHFARLRLLDPSRYTSLPEFKKEAEYYEKVADAIDAIKQGEKLPSAVQKIFARPATHIQEHYQAFLKQTPGAGEQLVRELLDEFGTGRVMFRNTRAALAGFPERRPCLVALDGGDNFFSTKIKWLADRLRTAPDEKFLLICETRDLVEQIQAALQRQVQIECAVFHEDLSLLQRDRNAAYFAEPEGARLLICSEIGSEGRNFQFAHHLVLFDLPTDPELLEQRIGRLDRIGQTATISIHVPYEKGGASEVLARWYDEGLNAFAASVPGATALAADLSAKRDGLMRKFQKAALVKFLESSRRAREKVAAQLSRGQDRLLELNSSSPGSVEPLIQVIRNWDEASEFESFFLRLLDFFGVQVEELSERSYLFKPGHLLTDQFPLLPEEGLSVTFDRTKALSREDLAFVSPDHPLVRSALDLLLGAEQGNSAFAIWEGAEKEGMLLEFYGSVECVAPASLHVDRFLPAQPLRVVIDHTMNESELLLPSVVEALRPADIFPLLDRGVFKRKILPGMIKKAEAVALARMQPILEDALERMHRQLRQEIERLEDLSLRNKNIREAEVEAWRQQRSDLEKVLRDAHVRTDSLRLIWCRP